MDELEAKIDEMVKKADLPPEANGFLTAAMALAQEVIVSATIDRIDEILGDKNAEDILLCCPICERRLVVSREDYRMNLALGGEPFRCDREECRGKMVPVFPEDVGDAKDEEEENYCVDFEGVYVGRGCRPWWVFPSEFTADLETMLVGATIVGYEEEEPDDPECDPCVILVLEKKGIQYRVKITPSDWMSFSGFEEDIPALRKMDPCFTNARLLEE